MTGRTGKAAAKRTLLISTDTGTDRKNSPTLISKHVCQGRNTSFTTIPDSREFPTGGKVENVIVETAKILPKGQITLPKDIREVLGVKPGDRVVLVSIDGEVVMMNPSVYALKMVQKKVEGRAKAAGIRDEDDVVELVREVRSDGNE